MSNPQWNKGAPPSIGWWPASGYQDDQVIRWWNGEYWSKPAWPNWPAVAAANNAMYKADSQKYISWAERWWL
jgi:hypothetical protein